MSEIIDVVFDVEGTSVPENYPFRLWDELVRIVPWMQGQENIGVIPLRGSSSGNRLLLSRRSKLILRLPAELEAGISALSGHVLNMEGGVLKVGAGKSRAILAAPTLHAWMVESDLDEVAFITAMREQLRSMGISCNLICDKHREISEGKQSLRGFGLVLHDLKPAASVQIQQAGLSGARHLGCGIFVPFKAITGLD